MITVTTPPGGRCCISMGHKTQAIRPQPWGEVVQVEPDLCSADLALNLIVLPPLPTDM